MGVALVASAAKGLTYGTCKDRTTMIINTVAAVISYYYPVTWIFPTLILAGGLVTLFTLRKVVRSLDTSPVLTGIHVLPADMTPTSKHSLACMHGHTVFSESQPHQQVVAVALNTGLEHETAARGCIRQVQQQLVVGVCVYSKQCTFK